MLYVSAYRTKGPPFVPFLSLLMADNRREPIERIPRPVLPRENPSTPRVSSMDLDTNVDFEEPRAAEHPKRKPGSKAQRSRKRRTRRTRVANLKAYPRVEMTRLSSGGSHIQEPDTEGREGAIEDPESSLYEDERVSELPDGDTDYVQMSGTITTAMDNINAFMASEFDGYDSSSQEMDAGDFTTMVNAASDKFVTRPSQVLRRQPSERRSRVEVSLQFLSLYASLRLNPTNHANSGENVTPAGDVFKRPTS